MSNEKKGDTLQGAPKVRAARAFKRIGTMYNSHHQMSIHEYGKGIIFDAGGGNKELRPTSKSRIRGDIQGWSSASRKRMREFLLTHKVPFGYSLFALTLTLPTKDTEYQYALIKDAVRKFFQELKRHEIGVVWRLEVQKRGAPHYHCIMQAPSMPLKRGGYPECDFEHARDVLQAEVLRWQIVPWWLTSCNKMGFKDYSSIEDAQRQSVEITAQTDKNAGWMKYLLDHCTKAKQEQIAVGIGRHWGVVNRKVFPDECPQVVQMKARQGVKILRVIQKWNRPRIRIDKQAAKSAWNTKLGFRQKRGSVGKSVWYGVERYLPRLLDLYA